MRGRQLELVDSSKTQSVSRSRLMLLRILKSKLHLACVTQTELYYHGSVTIDRDLMDAVGLLPYEQILVANCSTGQRGETYVIEGGRGTGAIQ